MNASALKGTTVMLVSATKPRGLKLLLTRLQNLSTSALAAGSYKIVHKSITMLWVGRR